MFMGGWKLMTHISGNTQSDNHFAVHEYEWAQLSYSILYMSVPFYMRKWMDLGVRLNDASYGGSRELPTISHWG